MRVVRASVVAVLVATLAVPLPACTQRESVTAAPQPKVHPPLIGTAGELRVAVDETYPPFAGTADGHVRGIDVDVAAALAERLGLKLTLVDVRPNDVAKALRDGRADAALGATPITESVLQDVAFAGTYLTDAPALFARTSDASAAAGPLGGARVAAQRGSTAQRLLERKLGAGKVATYKTLRAALTALANNRADVVGGDAIVGAYIARDLGGISEVRQLDSAVPLGVAVSKEATGFEPVVRNALDDLASSGVLDAIRAKWVGALPELRVTGDGKAP